MEQDIHAYHDEALKYAYENKHPEIIKYLLKNGASVYFYNNIQNLPLHLI